MEPCACGCGQPARRKFASRECQLRDRNRRARVTPRTDDATEPPVHFVIPDTQIKPGVPNDHLGWIGRYIVDQFAGRPLTVIHLGDHWDMPSLSSYDKGKKQMEGRRYKADVAAGNRAFALLDEPIAAETRQSGWAPRKVFLFGNHEDRITRAIDSDAQLDGILTLDDLDTRDWERHAFLEPVEIDGVHYAHYFYNPLTGRPLGGENLTLRLKNIGHSFTMGHQQQFLTAIRYVGGRMQRGLVAGACLTPDHRVLTADLRYVEVGKVEVGDEVVSFDEEVHGRHSRRYRTGKVRAVRHVPAEVFAVTLDDGKTFKVTADHLWLTRVGGQGAMREGGTFRWWRTDQLRTGTRIPRVLPEWDALTGYEAGWLAGMYDGEGCYYKRETTGGTIGQLSITQKPGPTFDRLHSLLRDVVGVDGLTHTTERGINNLRVRGGTRSIAQVLGQIRPERLLAKFRPEHLGRLWTTTNPKVVSIVPYGVRTVVQLDIDAGTMIVEGYPHHNCYQHEEDYLGPQGNSHWRGVLVKHQVEHGEYDLMEVSLDYLCRRYEGHRLRDHVGREL